MKKLLITILFFITVLPIMGQNDSINTIKSKVQTSIDINLLSAGLNLSIPVNANLNNSIYFGFNIGYKITPFLYEHPERDANGYIEILGIQGGFVYLNSSSFQLTTGVKVGFPLSNGNIPYNSPYYGVSFQFYYKISNKSLIGTNIDFGGIAFKNIPIFGIANSLITYRITIGK